MTTVLKGKCVAHRRQRHRPTMRTRSRGSTCGAAVGRALASDEWIVANTNNVTAVLWTLSRHALDHIRIDWLRRHQWRIRAAIRLHRGEATTTVNG
jgi:hypothetical protein